MTDIAARLREVIEERLRVARAAPKRWRSELMILLEAVTFVELNDPDDAILAAEHALGLLDEMNRWEHHECDDRFYSCGATGDPPAPCDCGVVEQRTRMLTALAKRFGVTE